MRMHKTLQHMTGDKYGKYLKEKFRLREETLEQLTTPTTLGWQVGKTLAPDYRANNFQFTPKKHKRWQTFCISHFIFYNGIFKTVQLV